MRMLEFVLKFVNVGQVVSVIGGFGSNEDVVVVENLVEAELRVVIVVGRCEQVIHFFVGNFTRNIRYSKSIIKNLNNRIVN